MTVHTKYSTENLQNKASKVTNISIDELKSTSTSWRKTLESAIKQIPQDIPETEN